MRSHIISALVVLLFAAAAWGGWNYLHHPKDSANKSDLRINDRPVMVTLGTISEKTVEHVVDAMGTLNAFESITISSKATGHVKRLRCDVSDRVRPGSVLLEIDSTDYDLAVRQAERALQVELSRIGLSALPPADFDIKQIPTVKHASSKLSLSQATADRNKTLMATRSSTQQDLENSLADMRMAEADYENQLLMAQASLATIAMRSEALAVSRQEQSNTIIRAPQPTQPVPFSEDAAIYAVSGRHISEGSYVRQGAELFQLVIDATLRFRVPVPEKFMSLVKNGQSVRVHVASSKDCITGQVTRINPTIDPASRAFEVEIIIDNRGGQLKPGGFAQAEIITATNQQAIVVPWESVVTFAGVTKVFLSENNVAKEVQVTLGRQGQDWVEIVSPVLPLGAKIVTGGQNGLADGVAIQERVIESASNPLEQTRS